MQIEPPKGPSIFDALPRPTDAPLAGCRSPDLNFNKTAVRLGDAGEIPVVSLEFFKSAVLPPLHLYIDVMKIKELLQQNDAVWSGVSQWWAGFATDPRESDKPEDAMFGPLSNIFDAVIGEASKITSTQAKLKFAARPTKSPTSKRSNSTRPDAYLLLLNKKSIDVQKAGVSKNDHPDSWDDIAVSFEFKRGDSETQDCEDDDPKVVWSFHHIMRSDPCRRATFGVTIENMQMRFWFTCRAITLVSEPFNFITEPKHLIHFFCALAFAEDHELGWDPTVWRACVEGEIQYNIGVRTDEGIWLVYQTTRVISDFSADALQGRATRVFEARLVSEAGKPVENSEPVVLKDFWRDQDRQREDVILDRMFTDLRTKQGIAKEAEARKYFLTILAAGDVTVNGRIDNTDNLLCCADLPADYMAYLLLVDQLLEPTRTGEGLTDDSCSAPTSSKQLKIHHRIHSRLVFKEVCQPIYEFQCLDTVFQTIMEVHKALQLMHSAGWVHRDISTSNLLRAPEIGKLADVEYAKPMDSKTSHKVRTGTLEFIACEVEAESYLFRRPFSDVNHDIAFSYNPLHDVESMWWIAIWVLYFHVDKEGSQPSPGQTDAFHKLFPGRLQQRTNNLLSSPDYRVLPAAFHDTALQLTNMKEHLRAAYMDSEVTLPPNYQNSLAALHSEVAKCLTSATHLSRGVKLFRPGAKRRLEDETSGNQSKKQRQAE